MISIWDAHLVKERKVVVAPEVAARIHAQAAANH